MAIVEIFKDSVKPWEKVTDEKLATLRALRANMQEESQSTLLLRKEAEDAQVQEELERTREKVQERLQECHHKKLHFERKQTELKEKVQRNEQFIRDTDAKIEQAEKKAKDEAEQMAKKEEELTLVEREIAALLEEKELEQKRIARFARYKKYLELVVREDVEFDGEVENVHSRYRTLLEGNLELRRAQAAVTAKLDTSREEWQRKLSRIQSEQLMSNSEFHECQIKLEKLRAERTELENRMAWELEERERKRGHIGVIRMAIEQLHTRAMSTCPKGRQSQDVIEKYGQKCKVSLMLANIAERVHELEEIAKGGRRHRAPPPARAEAEETSATIRFTPRGGEG